MTMQEQEEFFSAVTDVQLIQYLLADLHDDLPQRLQRFRYITDLGAALGPGGTMIFGGFTAHAAYVEARSCFVNGNFIATIMLCQSLVENLLAAFLHGGLLDELPARIPFDETLKRCRERGLLTDGDIADLKRLAGFRNPLAHFRNVSDASNLDRRSIDSGASADKVVRSDAHFAFSVMVRMLAKPPFRLG
jgi:hypothetical protein